MIICINVSFEMLFFSRICISGAGGGEGGQEKLRWASRSHPLWRWGDGWGSAGGGAQAGFALGGGGWGVETLDLYNSLSSHFTTWPVMIHGAGKYRQDHSPLSIHATQETKSTVLSVFYKKANLCFYDTGFGHSFLVWYLNGNTI